MHGSERLGACTVKANFTNDSELRRTVRQSPKRIGTADVQADPSQTHSPGAPMCQCGGRYQGGTEASSLVCPRCGSLYSPARMEKK